MKNVHKLTEGAVFLAVFAVLLLITLYIPVLGIVVNLFLSLPFILFAAKNNRKGSLVFLIAAVLISLIVGTILAIPITLAYGLTGIVIGDFIREQKSRTSAFIAGTLVFLANLLVQYAAAVVFFKINFIEETIKMMKESLDMSVGMLETMGQNADEAFIEQFEAGLKMLETLTPSLFVMISLSVVFLIQLVSFPIVKRFGVKTAVWKPFREISMPKSILWYYLIAIIASFVFNPGEGSYWFLALVNISFILQLFMIIQGLSFIFFFSYLKGLPRALPIIAAILTFFIPFLLYIVRILGIIDLGFGLRQRLGKNVE